MTLDVLLVENDQLDQRAFTRLVTREQLPYEYVIAGSVAAGVALLHQRHFDIVLIDYNLGDGTGLDVLKSVPSETAAIFITGTGSEEIAVQAMRAGANDYLIKDVERTYLKLLPITIDRAIRDNSAEKRLQTLSQAIISSRDSIFMTDLDGTITFVNQAFCDTYHYDDRAIIGCPCAVLYTPGHNLLQWEEVSDYECVHLRQGGERFPVLMSRSTVRDNQGTAFARVVVAHDITEQKRTQDILRESEERYRSVVAAMGEGIVLQDRTGKIRACNASAERILGLSADQMMGRTSIDSPWQPIHEDQTPFPGDEHPAMRTLQTGESQHNIIMGVHKPDGGLTWIAINTEPLWHDSKEQPSAVVASFSDITHLKNALAERDSLIESLDSFAHTVAHDLKNPISQILGYSNILADAYDDFGREEIIGYLRTMERQATKMAKIIDALLLLASTSRLTAIPSDRLNIPAIVAEVLQRLGQMIEESSATISVQPEFPHVLGYAPWIEEVLVNYVSNALKYGGQPPHVEIGAETLPSNRVRFWVRDNGTGLTPEEQAQLFTPFTRLTQAKIEGHGLGLSIVRQIVERLGGTVGVTSEMGHGSEFSFTLPLETIDAAESPH